MTKQTEQGAADREAFEAWASKARLSVDRSKHETLPYESGLTNWCWEAFQTGRQSASAISTPEGCALGNRDLPNFDPADLTIDSFPRRPPGGMQVGMSVGVLVRHKPSGFSVIVDNHRSQHRNRDEALRQLAFLVHVFGDMPAATSHPTPKE